MISKKAIAGFAGVILALLIRAIVASPETPKYLGSPEYISDAKHSLAAMHSEASYKKYVEQEAVSIQKEKLSNICHLKDSEEA